MQDTEVLNPNLHGRDPHDRFTSTPAVCGNAPMPMPARLDASPGYSPSRRLRVSELV